MHLPSNPSRVIVIFGTKGGTGKTVVAANLAVSLSKAGSATVLLDCDSTAMGDAAKILQLAPQHAIADLSRQLDASADISADVLNQVLVKHSSGIQLLALAREPRQLAQIKPQWIAPLLAALRQRFAFIVIDAGRGLTDTVRAFLDEANLFLLVATPDIVSLAQVKRTLELMAELLYPQRLMKLVLNRAQSRGGVGTDDVRGVVACDVIASIPSDGPAVVSSINQGVPVVLTAAKHKIAQAFQQLAETCRTRPDLFLEPARDPQVLAQRRAVPSEEPATTGAPATPPSAAAANGKAGAHRAAADPWSELKRRIHDNLVEKLNLRRLDYAALGSDEEKSRELRAKTESLIMGLLAKETGGFLQHAEQRARLIKEITDEALGLGPLEDLLADPTVNDILVNKRDQIYVERYGKLELTDKQFTSDDQLRTVIERIVAPLGRRIDEANPMVDARLADGSRVNAIIPPLALRGPTVSIRKFSRERYTTDDLVRFGSVTPAIVRFLEACVRARKNIIISGGTGSGKTTFLNIVSSFIPNNERIVTIEDAAELRLDQDHLVSLESRMPNIEGKGQITIRDLFRNALRMRPDRIVIGECRGGETLDMLQAMNTGHDGSLTTIHANSPRDCISRLDSLILMSSVDLPVRAIREQVVSAIDLIVHTARLSDGSRKVTAISEITGLKDNLEVEFRDVFLFHQTGMDKETGKVLGQIAPTGQLPTFLNDILVRGLDVNEEMFTAPAEPLIANDITLMGSPDFDV